MSLFPMYSMPLRDDRGELPLYTDVRMDYDAGVPVWSGGEPVLVSGTDGVDTKRRSRRGCERKGQCDNRKCPGSNDLNLMRWGINNRRLIAHAIPFLRQGPVIRLPVFAVKKRESETRTEMRSPRTGDGGAFAHRRHCANRRR